MSPAKRITKKQMKEDRLVSSVFKTSEYIQKNPKPFIIVGTAAAVIFIAVILFLWNIDKKNTQAAGYLARAQISYDRGFGDDAVIDLQTVVDNYSNTSAAADRSSALPRLARPRLRAVRATSPLSTRPGPTSSTRSTPSA